MRKIWLGALLLPLMGCDFIALGDSITWQSGPEIKEVFGQNGLVDGIPGRGPRVSPRDDSIGTTTIAVENLAQYVKQDGILIVQDEGGDEDYASFSEFVKLVNETARPDVCIVWVEPFTLDNRERDAEILRAIEDNRFGHRHSVARWGEIAAAYPELLLDNVHLTPEGTEVFVQELWKASWNCITSGWLP